MVCRVLLSFLHLLYRHFIRPSTNLRKYVAGRGAWAVVTGSTDGIGKEYAKQLAKRGFNIFLISRNEERLGATANEIRAATNKIEVKSLALDLSAVTESSIATIRSALAGLDIGILINNAGISYDYPVPFVDLNQKMIRTLIELNTVQLTELTQLILPRMIEKKRGLIVNLSSGSGIFPAPLLAVYSGTKAYVTYFTESLAFEVKRHGIDVECQVPFLVVSKLSKARAAWMVPSASSYVRQAISQLGSAVVISPHYVHDLIRFVFALLPQSYVMSHFYSRFYKAYKRAIMKKVEGKDK